MATKKQERISKQLNDLEFQFDDLFAMLKEANENKKFLKKHETIVTELKYYFGSISQRLNPPKTSTKNQW